MGRQPVIQTTPLRSGKNKIRILHQPIILLVQFILLHEFNVVKTYAFSSIYRPTPITTTSNVLSQPSFFQNNNNNYASSSISKSKSSTILKGKLWDNVGIEESEEIEWYLLNCIVCNELALKSQVDIVLAEFPSEEVEQISVPTSRALRSHGKRHVIDDKVLYPGYVFVKMRLTCDVYEAIQLCTLCRSFMGTIRMQGMYNKLPSIPTPLSPEEVDGFKGLEEKLMKETHISEDELLSAYKGYEVGQMCKVLSGKHVGEDGVIKRLKNLKIGVRLFTYGSSFDEWFEPDDVRLLTELETLRGLSGPDKPIFNKDFQELIDPKPKPKPRPVNDSSGRNIQSVFGSSGGMRNRRQDRVVRGDAFYSNEGESEQREKRNWENYKQKQAQPPQRQSKQTSYDIERAISLDEGPKRSSASTGMDYLNDIMMESSSPPSTSQKKTPTKQKTQDDFLNTLLEDFDTSFGSSSRNQNRAASNTNVEEDDFFAKLDQEMSADPVPPPSDQKEPSSDQNNNAIYNDDEDLTFQEIDNNKALNILDYDGSSQEELLPRVFEDDLPKSSTDDDFFNSLDLDDLYSTTPEDDKPKSSEKKSYTKKQVVAEQQQSSSLSVTDETSSLQKLTVPQLKEQLRTKSLKVSGKKSELIQRLLSS